MYEFLICPICKKDLSRHDNSLVCPENHSYDIAKSGYVNLLAPGRKNNFKSGDNSEMVIARRNFLSRGYYDRYVKSASEIARRCLGYDPNFYIDAACGEGHHTTIIADCVGAEQYYGADASKKAADIASRNAKDGRGFYFAGNIFSLPVKNKCADLVSVLFAPVPFEEARRVLNDDGCLMICSAAPDHLHEMRSLIYDEVIIKDFTPPTATGFETVKCEKISYFVALNGSELRDLFLMTPFCYRSGTEGKKRIENVNNTDITVSVMCSVLKKSASKEAE